MTCLATATVISSQEPLIKMTSLMHHSSTHRIEMRNPNQGSMLHHLLGSKFKYINVYLIKVDAMQLNL